MGDVREPLVFLHLAEDVRNVVAAEDDDAVVAVLIKVLERTALYANLIHPDTRVESLFENTSRCYVFKFCTYESCTFSGFHVKKFYDEIILSFQIDAHSVSEISCCCHKLYLSELYLD